MMTVDNRSVAEIENESKKTREKKSRVKRVGSEAGRQESMM